MSEPSMPLCEICNLSAVDAVHDMVEDENGIFQPAGEHHYCRAHFKPGLWTHRGGKKTRGLVEVKE